MPFSSKAQQAYLYAKKPEIAAKFAAHTPRSSYKKLPEHVHKSTGRFKAYLNKNKRQKDVQ